MSYFFSTPVDIDIVLEDTDERAMVDVKLDKNRKEKVPLEDHGDTHGHKRIQHKEKMMVHL